MSTDDLIETFKHLTLGELTEFCRRFENTFGVTAEMPATTRPADVEDVITSEFYGPVAFTVRLTAIGPTKVPVIKAVRTLTGLGLREAKDRVEAKGRPEILVGVTREAAEKAHAALTAESASAEILPIYDDAPRYLGPQ